MEEKEKSIIRIDNKKKGKRKRISKIDKQKKKKQWEIKEKK